MEERQHLLRGELFSRTEKETEWRFCRAQIVRVWTPTFAAANIFCRPRRFQQPPCYCRILWDANIFDGAPIFHVGADILWALIFHGRQYFMGANISWPPIFHGRQYFMDANISWPPIFHGRQYFMDTNISWTPIFHGRQYFDVS